MGRRQSRDEKKTKKPVVKRSAHRIYVGPWLGGWQLKLDGKRLATSLVKGDLVELSILLARLQAHEGPTERTVANRWGKIREKDTYGRKDDPASSKG